MLQNLREQNYHKLVTTPTPRWVRSTGLTIAVGIIYFLSARLSLFLVNKPTDLTFFWPAAGVASGLLIALGPAARWPVVVGTMVATLAANLLGDRNVGFTAAAAIANAGGALLVAWLIERYFGPNFALDKLVQVLGLIAATVMAAAVSGVIGTAGYVFFRSSAESIATIWEHWFSAIVVGVVAIAPLLIGFSSAIRDPPTRREVIEGLIALAMVAAVLWLAIFELQVPWAVIVPSAAMFPLLLWLAARSRPVFGSVAAFIISLAALCITTFGRGHFFDADVPIDDRILAAQVTILGTSLCALVLSALFAERREHEAALTESEARLQEALTAGAVTAFDWEVHTGLSRRSENAAQVLGFDPQQTLTPNCFLASIHPDDRKYFKATLRGLRPDRPSYVVTFRFIRPDGREMWLEEASKAEFDGGGRLVRIKGLNRDITKSKQAENRQNMLMAELDHRVKNVLARVAVVADYTRQGSRTMDEFVNVLDGRIQAMADAHTLLSRSRWQGVDLAALVRDQLAPYTNKANTTVSGPHVVLSDALTQAVAMVLHELVTNAAKYGALSVPAGQVSVSWSRHQNERAAESLMLDWRETGGPPILAAIQPGCGTSLIRDLIPHELGGTVDLVFAADGVRCRIDVPLSQSRNHSADSTAA